LNDLFYNNKNELGEILGIEKQKALDSFMDALISSFEKRYSEHLKFLNKISAAVKHVCSVLDLQRQYLGEKSSPLKKDINLFTMINDTLVMMSDNLKKRDINARLNTNNKILTVSGDQTALMRVFINLIQNVCEAFDIKEYAENRMLKIKLTSSKIKKVIKITFTDNAVGFNPEYSEKLFERGYTSKTNGSGIGLHECRDIVQTHGGKMTIESKGKNKGSTTTIKFPL
jgi:signal transduction histidine kinase